MSNPENTKLNTTKQKRGNNKKQKPKFNEMSNKHATEKINNTKVLVFWLFYSKLTQDKIENLKNVCFKYFCSVLPPLGLPFYRLPSIFNSEVQV